MKDAQLAELADEYSRLQASLKRTELKKDKVKTRILREMERRGTEGIITNGFKITYVQQRPVVYDPVRLKRVLGELWPDAVTEKVDPAKLSALVQEGRVPLAKVARCGHEELRAPYITVTPDSGE